MLVVALIVQRGLLGIGYPGYLFREPNLIRVFMVSRNLSKPARQWVYCSKTEKLKTRGTIHPSPKELGFLASKDKD